MDSPRIPGLAYFPRMALVSSFLSRTLRLALYSIRVNFVKKMTSSCSLWTCSSVGPWEKKETGGGRVGSVGDCEKGAKWRG